MQPALWLLAFLSQNTPAMRPLPAPSERPAAPGPVRYVDAATGSDQNDGSAARPWKTIGFAQKKLAPGETLYLRGGTYYEHVVLSCSDATIRSAPGELAVIDGGFREFFDSPSDAWEPCPGGVQGEYRSKKPYPGLQGSEKNHAHVMGNFADSMVPLQGYRYHIDLQSTNEFWNIGPKLGADKGIYCGPGVWYDLQTEHIHARLAPTTLKGLGDDNYRGETDPRKLRLVIAGGLARIPLRIQGARRLRIQDLVVRGSVMPTVVVEDAEALELDGVTAYGGSSAFSVKSTRRLFIVNCAFRGLAAPWTFRTSQKYRGWDSKLFNAGTYGGGNEDFEISYSEFTDNHDGLFIGNVKNVSFHHNLADNFNDDGVFLTAHTGDGGEVAGGNIRIFQNRFSRILSTFAFGIGRGVQSRTGAGVYVYRNVFDLRRPVPYFQPKGPEEPQELVSRGRVWGEHGSPVWEPLYIYHNTIVTAEPAFRNYYAAGWASHTRGTARRILNNVFLQLEGMPGTTRPPPEDDFKSDGNLNWSVQAGAAFAGDFYATLHKAGLESKGVFADPRFMQLGEWSTPGDWRLKEDSPALDAGVAVPAEWSDPLREKDAGAPDIGAFPRGAPLWRIGVRGRLPATP